MIALIVIPKNPNKYDPYKHEKSFNERFDMLLQYYLYRGVIDQEEYEQIKSEKLTFNMKHENKLPYVVNFLQN
jgi:membrane peptidoglycan carboxypeptidase